MCAGRRLEAKYSPKENFGLDRLASLQYTRMKAGALICRRSQRTCSGESTDTRKGICLLGGSLCPPLHTVACGSIAAAVLVCEQAVPATH